MTAAWAWDALQARTAAIEAAVGDRFPLHAGDEGWTTTRRGSWTGGFWAGLLWLRAAALGRPRDLEIARRWTARLPPRAADDTDTRAMTFWYGAGLGHRWCGEAEAGEIAAAGARAVAASALPGSGLIPVGTAFGRAGAARAGVDALAAVVALLEETGRHAAAVRHVDALVPLLVDDRGEVRPHADLTGSAPPAVDGLWSRGQAWGVLGLAVAADRLGGRHRAVAERVAERWLSLAGHGVPPAAFGTAASVDTSAAVIAAAGLWTLGDHAAAGAIIDTVVAGHLRPDGVLTGGCYDLAAGVACAHELIWGTYFLTAAIAVRTGRLPRGW
ncbi:hypothetical protein [Couchioplanes caeruleus]|uniref:Unsaturated chondroitin disaccharide hydrolase n=2 Tax=Couchioplanes caeruleus TaxID=56438 RepID=A0A1K0FA74_9ACTN|nr:hypothetical protein [Couchioplanes caeruleus]OJF09743.1 hypothetical protein BG844_35865 [Couchioplanes caeruleus subsp. caeruleus]ROP28890.1 unsaturated chondroitin disaccharide hydrolase [Couchioplanes caeruleus]